MILALALVLLFGASALNAQSVATGLYNEANALYRSGDFAGAHRLYREVVATGVRDARLFYNLGNANFKLGRMGEAILWYERAQRLAPHDEDIENNLRFANLIKKDREPADDRNAVLRGLSVFYFWPSADQLSLLFALCFLALFGLAARRLLASDRLGVVWLSSVSLCSMLSAVFALWLVSRLQYRAGIDEAIVVAEKIMARSGPAESQTEVFTAHEGTKVRLVRSEGQWVLVRLANGLGGWMRDDALERI